MSAFSKEELLMLSKIFKQQEKGQDEVGALTFLPLSSLWNILVATATSQLATVTSCLSLFLCPSQKMHVL